jgi:NodT family efflux transporter outer membrane factor (OMF) lipoprotein
VHNGFKVGPNYKKPPAPVARNWIDASDKRLRTDVDDLSKWWTVFNDPILDSLICFAYNQNLSLRAAGFRVLEARAQLCIEIGNLLPQMQTATGDFKWNAASAETQQGAFLTQFGKRFYGQYDFAFNLGWELDFWGRFRRAVEADADLLDSSVDNFDDVLVTLLGDVATNYVNLRVTQQQIKYAQANAALQRETLKIVEARFKAGTTTELDVAQARSTLEQTEATIPQFQITARQYSNALCTLLGIPPEDLEARIGSAPIPTAPVDVAAGIPADLLRRRPDVRSAERQAAAQCAEIGVAEAQFYPMIAINGTLGWSAESFKNLFRGAALNAYVGPAFTWNILNYGRILNNVRLQDAKFQELVATYQNKVLSAAQEVENGLVAFLRAQERTRLQAASVKDAELAVKIGLAQYKAGTVDFTRVTQLEVTVAQLQDTLAQAQGQIDTGLIQAYRALGGGWQIRVNGCTANCLPGDAAPQPVTNTLPAPRPLPVSEPAPPMEKRGEAPARFGVPLGQ